MFYLFLLYFNFILHFYFINIVIIIIICLYVDKMLTEMIDDLISYLIL